MYRVLDVHPTDTKKYASPSNTVPLVLIHALLTHGVDAAHLTHARDPEEVSSHEEAERAEPRIKG